MSSAAVPAVTDRDWAATARKAAIVLLFAVLAYRAAQFAITGWGALYFPWSFDYGEGIVWQQARDILTPKAYGAIDGFPTIVYHYTPLYHAVSWLAAQAFGTDELSTGRAVSLLSTLVAGLVTGGIAAMVVGRDYPARHRTLAFWLTALLTLTFVPIIDWAPLMRVDMLAMALTLGGLFVGMKAIEKPGLIVPASLLFVAAVYTKQTSIAAPAALFAVLLLVRTRTALIGIATCIVTGLAALFALNAVTDGGFVRHVFLYNVNRIDLSRLIWIIFLFAAHAIYTAVAGWVAFRRASDLRSRYTSVAALRRADIADVRTLVVLSHLAVNTLLLLLAVKSGSAINYFLEWCYCVAIFVAIGAQERAPETPGKPFVSQVIWVGTPLLIAMQAFMTTGHPFQTDPNSRWARELGVLSREIRASDRPALSEDMVLLLRSGQDVLWEPAIFAELGSNGVWDEKPFIQRIRNREFAFILTTGERGEEKFDRGYNRSVAEAFEQAYPIKQRYAGYIIYRDKPAPPTP